MGFGIHLANAQEVTFYTPRTVHIVKAKGGQPKQGSLVVTAHPEKVKVRKSTTDGITTYSTSALTVKVEGGNVAFYDPNGNLLTAEGESRFTPITEGPDKGAYRVKQSFSVEADEGIYGIGLLQNGKMSQRGENRRMEQSNLEDYAHIYQSIKGYGIYWENYSPTRLQTPPEGVSGELSLESEVGTAVDYYFSYGSDADGVIAELRHLTGKVPMLPLWTYGFHQCRERYKSADQLLEVVRKYREMGVPFDGIIQDWQYWGSNYTWNAMEFINDEFSNAQRMIDEVHEKNAHMSISIWSSFGPQTKQYAELKEKGHLLSFETWPQSGLPFWPPRMDYPSGVLCYDVYSPEARDIYWKYLSNLHDMGIDAWWMDSTDPDHHSYKDSDLDELTAMGSYRSVRNIYPLMAVGGVHDNQRAADSTKRVFILTRSYFAGQQRYGANTWSGDIGSSWDSFRKQVPICLNYTLTANPNVNTDIGGFFAGSYSTKGHNSATRNPQYQELFVRWMQFGAFSPMMRSHGADIYRELYYFGNPGDPVYDALLDAIRLRYRLMPYTYSHAWQVSHHDDSFMRALFMDFKNDKQTWDNKREFMYGRNLLVCPVLDPLYTEEKIERTRGKEYPTVDWTAEKRYDVYLPQGTKWYDYYTNQCYDGGQELSTLAPLAYAPLYVKAGSIIPLGPDVQYTNEKPWDNLDIIVYPGANGEFTLYEDEGDNYNYEKGLYSTITFKWNDKSGVLTIDKRQGSFPGMLTQRTFNVKIAGTSGKTISYNGKRTTVKLK
ncbi:MAG: glycoside hydrolase family 31 protein [Bacteroidaceae bacterium]|nr:glycoside hydrolase family 31 protein [Bacteroidaceae bacterium]